MKRPNAIVHMTVGGFMAGGAAGGVYGALVMFGMALFDGFMYLNGSEFLFAAMVGGVIGAPMGLALGFLSGFALDWVVRRMEYPYSDERLQRLRQQTRFILFILAGIGAVLGFGRLFMGGYIELWGVVFFVLLPAAISTGSALWVAERYIKRLAEWGQAKRKVAA